MSNGDSSCHESNMQQVPEEKTVQDLESPARSQLKQRRKRKAAASPTPEPLELVVASYESVEAARRQNGRPPHQATLQLVNVLGNICYASSATNLVLAAPAITKFFGLRTPTGGLVGMMHTLALTLPNEVCDNVQTPGHFFPFRAWM